jgi:acyl-CoA hydrolase
MIQSQTRPTRTVASSSVTDQVHMVFPNDLNANDTVFGGLIMALMDRLAVVVASRHAGRVCVTAGVDAVNFIAPARRGDVLIYSVAVNRAWNTSIVR